MKIVLSLIAIVVGFGVGASIAPSPGVTVDSGTVAIKHVAALAFGLFAAYLLIKKSDQTLIVTFAIGVLATIAGVYIGPIVTK